MPFVGCEVFRNNFWMLHHGSKSPKRTTVWSVRRFLVSGLVYGSAQNAPGIMNVHMNTMYTRPQLEQPRTKGRWRKLPKRKRPPSRPRVLFPVSCILLWGLDQPNINPTRVPGDFWGKYKKKDGSYGFCGSKELKGTQWDTQYTCFQLSQMSCIQLECGLRWSRTNYKIVLSFVLREYPKGLGRCLVGLMKKNNPYKNPQPTLRQKYDLTKYDSELKLFQSLPMKDTWPDAKLRECYMYLWYNKNLCVPPAWKSTMRDFTTALQSATWLHRGDLFALYCIGMVWSWSKWSKVSDPDPFSMESLGGDSGES